MNDFGIVAFKGIPSPFDYVPYEKAYYQTVKNRTIEEFGEHATLLDATRAMNLLGNVSFFKKFPDLYNCTEEALGYLYQPEFEVLENEFTDFEHGLSHIRAQAAHTSMGESMLKPDQFYLTGMRYPFIMKVGHQIDLKKCSYHLQKISPLNQFNLPHPTFVKMELYRVGIRHRPNFQAYRNTYHSDKYQIDYPEKTHLSKKFFTNPANEFEKRLSLQLVRAIYMDEKFKKYSSYQTSFISAPVNVTTKESYKLAFTNDEENQWINKIAQIVLTSTPKNQLQTIVNTTHSKSNNPQIVATETIKIIAQHYL